MIQLAVGIPSQRYKTLPTAINAATMAAMARILSRPLTVGAAATGAGRGVAGATGRCCWEIAGAAAAVARGAAAGAAAAAARAGLATVGMATVTELGAPVGPPGGSVGNLIVGAAVGFGGKVMRTVSFFG